MEMSRTNGHRVFVLGLDGVPWPLLEQWIAAGELPAFRELVRTGAAGPLQSTMPPSTPLAWPSIATGTWPDRHGVYAFQKLGRDYTQHMYTSRDVRQPALWELMEPAIVANVPMTYPATEIDGLMVSGFLNDSFDDGFTYPPEFTDELLAAIPDYRIGLDWGQYRNRLGEFEAELTELLRTRRALLEHLMTRDDWRLFFFVFVSPDRLQHLVWEEERLLAHYRRLDDILADVIQYVDDRSATLFVVSDHGFGPVDGRVSVNSILRNDGYLHKKSQSGVRSVLDQLGIRKDRVLNALSTVGIDETTLVNRVPNPVIEFAATTTPGNHGLYDVDFHRTVAFGHGIGSVYVNDSFRFDHGIVAPGNVPRIAADIRALFESVTTPAGDRVFTVYDGTDLYPNDPLGPDLVLDAERYVPVTSLQADVFSDADGLVADHRPEGVFLARGPDIDAGVSVDADVVDVAPTVLHTAAIPLPETVDGRVLQEVYAPDSDAVDREVRTRAYGEKDVTEEVNDDFSGVEDRLKGLGYME